MAVLPWRTVWLLGPVMPGGTLPELMVTTAGGLLVVEPYALPMATVYEPLFELPALVIVWGTFHAGSTAWQRPG